jgi:hypothetical protein
MNSFNISFSALLAGLALTALCASAADTATAATVTLGDLTPIYDGTPKTPSATTDPSGLDVNWRFVQPVTVFDRIGNPLALSYISFNPNGYGTTGFGDYVQLAGSARDLESVDAVLVTWVKAADYPALSAADPTGWDHPITLGVYDYDEPTGNFTFLGEVTRDIHIPWRPLTKADGSPYPYNGYAFEAHFDFPPGITLPEKTMLLLSYNTQKGGYHPIGEPGPYNALNIALGGTETIGSDVDPGDFLWVKSPTEWFYPASPTPQPMFRIRTSGAGNPATSDPPTDAGSWQATATIDNPDFAGWATETLTILPAPVDVQLSDLTRIADGSPKSATVTTNPPGVATTLTYDGSSDSPSALGRYAAHAETTDPNYTGSADDTLWIGQNLESWISPQVDDGSIPADDADPEDDPDRDGIVNLLEYAWGLNPAAQSRLPGKIATPQIRVENGTPSIIFRKNTAATDLVFQIETSPTLNDPNAWTPVGTIDSIISSEDGIDTIRAMLTPDPGAQRLFFRLRVEHQ